jgi:WhiB family redox-sensing transcriptional regulator
MTTAIALATTEPDWRRQAACRHADPDLFFPKVGDHQTAAGAVAVCRSCPVIDACLRDALASGEHHGIRGGLTAIQRRKMLAAQRRLARHLARRNPLATVTGPIR